MSRYRTSGRRRLITARWAGQCTECRLTVERGRTAVYDPARKTVAHPGCVPVVGTGIGDRTDLDYEDQCAAACGL